MLFKRAQQHLVAAVSESAVQTHGLLYIQILEVSVMIIISRLWLHIPSLSCSHYLLSEAIFDLLPMLNNSQRADRAVPLRTGSHPAMMLLCADQKSILTEICRTTSSMVIVCADSCHEGESVLAQFEKQ